MQNTKWLVIANKQDLPNAAHSSELEGLLDIKKYSCSIHYYNQDFTKLSLFCN